MELDNTSDRGAEKEKSILTLPPSPLSTREVSMNRDDVKDSGFLENSCCGDSKCGHLEQIGSIRLCNTTGGRPLAQSNQINEGKPMCNEEKGEVKKMLEKKTASIVPGTPRTKQEFESVSQLLLDGEFGLKEDLKGYSTLEEELWDKFLAKQNEILYSTYKSICKKQLYSLFSKTNGVIPINRKGLKSFLIYNKIFNHHVGKTGKHAANQRNKGHDSAKACRHKTMKDMNGNTELENLSVEFARKKITTMSMTPSPLRTSRIIQTPKRYLDGERIQKPPKRQSTSCNQLPLHKDKNVFQIGLLPPKYPKSLENSPSNALYPDPLSKEASNKIGLEQQQALGGFFQISHLLQSGELKKAILQHQLKEINKKQQRLLRSESLMKYNMFENQDVNEGSEHEYLENNEMQDPSMGENFQPKPNFLQRQTFMCVPRGEEAIEINVPEKSIKPFDCAGYAGYDLLKSSKQYSARRIEKLIASLKSTTTLPLAVSFEDTRLCKSLDLIHAFTMRSLQENVQAVRRTEVFPAGAQQTFLEKIQRLQKTGQLHYKNSVPKIPVLTRKTFKSRATKKTVLNLLLHRKVHRNSKVPSIHESGTGINDTRGGQVAFEKAEGVFPSPPPLKPYPREPKRNLFSANKSFLFSNI